MYEGMRMRRRELGGDGLHFEADLVWLRRVGSGNGLGGDVSWRS